MAGRKLSTPGVPDPEPTQEEVQVATPEASTENQTEPEEQQVPEPTYEELKEHLAQEQNKHIQFLNDPELLKDRLLELVPDLELSRSPNAEKKEKQQRVVLGQHGWTKEDC